MLKLPLYVGMPTSKRLFEVHLDMLWRLWAGADADEALGCPGCMAKRLHWVKSVALRSMGRQPVGICYRVRWGLHKMLRVMNDAEVYFMSVQLCRLSAGASVERAEQESVDDYLDRMTKPDTPTEGIVFH